MHKIIIANYLSLNLLAISKSSLEVDRFVPFPHVLALVPPNLTHYSTYYTLLFYFAYHALQHIDIVLIRR